MGTMLDEDYLGGVSDRVVVETDAVFQATIAHSIDTFLDRYNDDFFQNLIPPMGYKIILAGHHCTGTGHVFDHVE